MRRRLQAARIPRASGEARGRERFRPRYWVRNQWPHETAVSRCPKIELIVFDDPRGASRKQTKSFLRPKISESTRRPLSLPPLPLPLLSTKTSGVTKCRVQTSKHSFGSRQVRRLQSKPSAQKKRKRRRKNDLVKSPTNPQDFL